jgi:predicted DNA-binding transcriptional regulator AlpA
VNAIEPRQKLLRTPEAAAYIGLSVSSLTKFRCAGKGPRFVRLSGAVRYREADLDEWLKGGIVETTDSRRQQARA